MKKITFIVFFLAIFTNAQTTAIPDAAFEQALIDEGIDTNGLNGNILNSDAQGVTSLIINNRGITDMTGIEIFTDLISFYCTQNNLTSLDVTSNLNLQILMCWGNNISNLNISTNTILFQLSCDENNLSNIDLSNNTSLMILECGENPISSLDLSALTNLQTLNCSLASITAFDFTNNTNLRNLYCNFNQITELDLSNLPNFERLNCSNNLLTSLSVKNGNNTNVTYFNTTNNPSLICIDVDDVAYSTANWAGIDIQTSFSINCSGVVAPTTAIPDANFEQALIDLGIDTNGLSGDILNTDAIGITAINVTNKGISDVTGIEVFTELVSFNCTQNNITDLNMSNNLNLQTLTCTNNNINNLNISTNTNLTHLSCDSNNLSSLDLTNNTQLFVIDCSYNPLSLLNLSSLTSLYTLDCTDANLTTLDFTNNTNLSNLYCSYNQITSLDLSNLSSLERIFCSNNSLTSLSVKNGNNTNVTLFGAGSNPDLTCIDVDDVDYSTTNWTNIDIQTTYSLNCSLSVDSNTLEIIQVYPNPATDFIHINNPTNKKIVKTELYNVLGKKVWTTTKNNLGINVKNFPKGIYFLSIKTANKTIIKQVLVK